jgi:transcriptional antiterminator RfaH
MWHWHSFENQHMNNLKEAELAPDDMVLEGGWYLAYTKPRQEQMALQNLELQGYEAYLPFYKKFKSTEQGLVALFEVMFPRYIFFRPGRAGQGIAPVRSTKGVATVIRFGVEPAVLTDELLQSIRQIEQERNQATQLDLSLLKSGQTVRLKHTALAGIEGLVQSVSSQRVAVLLEILGRPMVVDLKHHQVQAS